MNLTTLAAAGIFLLCIWNGWRKGLVRKLSQIAAVVISSVLVWAMLPAVTSFLKNSTPVYEMIVTVCESTVSSGFGTGLVSRMSSSDSSASGSTSYGSTGVSGTSSQENAEAAVSQDASVEVIQVNPADWQKVTGSGSRVSFSQTSSLSGSLSSGNYDRESIRQIMNQYGLDGSRLDSMSDDQIKEYVDLYLTDYLNQVGSASDLSGASSILSQTSGLLNNLTKIEQTRLIQSLPVPSSLRKTLLNYNNSEGYKTLGAESFADYLIRFIANVILNILAFFATMLIVNLIVRAALSALDLIARIPGIYLINRVGGLAAGAVQGVLVMWMLFLVISLFSGTEVGMMLLDQINSSILLRPLYQSNVFLKIVTNAINSIM